MADGVGVGLSLICDVMRFRLGERSEARVCEIVDDGQTGKILVGKSKVRGGSLTLTFKEKSQNKPQTTNHTTHKN